MSPLRGHRLALEEAIKENTKDDGTVDVDGVLISLEKKGWKLTEAKAK